MQKFHWPPLGQVPGSLPQMVLEQWLMSQPAPELLPEPEPLAPLEAPPSTSPPLDPPPELLLLPSPLLLPELVPPPSCSPMPPVLPPLPLAPELLLVDATPQAASHEAQTSDPIDDCADMQLSPVTCCWQAWEVAADGVYTPPGQMQSR